MNKYILMRGSFFCFYSTCASLCYLWMIVLYTMYLKSDVTKIVKSFNQLVQTQFSLPIKVPPLDNGGEYVNVNCLF